MYYRATRTASNYRLLLQKLVGPTGAWRLVRNRVARLYSASLSSDAGVTGQSIGLPPAGLYPGLKRPMLDYARVYYGLGYFIPRGILWPRPIHTPPDQIIHP